MKTSDFDYELPAELIAQTPVEPRDSSRLLVLHRETGEIEHRYFRDIGDYMARGDLLVANNSRVLPARLLGRKTTGGKSEILLLERMNATTWKALVKGKRTRIGTEIVVWTHAGEPSGVRATILAELHGAQRLVEFSQPLESEVLAQLGHTPLPPYIRQQVADPERYQTVYSRSEGSAAAPTAGLHFTPDLLLQLRGRGIGFETVTLHVGLDTFKPVVAEQIVDHDIHTEWVEVGRDSAEKINKTHLAKHKTIAIGTTSVRVLETAALRAAGITGELRTISNPQSALPHCPWKPVIAYEGPTDLYIYPGYQFRAVNALITNFHLPQSSLLMLVSAFAGYDTIRHAYEVAIAEKYRFFSFGDAMLII